MTARVTVALATFNAEVFLGDFLESLSNICPKAHELVVSDDGSTDSTLDMLATYARAAEFPVRILRGGGRLGVTGNFSRVIAASRGDWVALADQDDVWREDKLSRLLDAVGTPEVTAAFSDADLVGPSLEPLGHAVWDQVGLTKGWRKRFDRDRPWEVLFREPVVAGTTLIFRRDLLAAILPIPLSWVHDGWISQIAASQGRVVAVPEPLVLYRQHGGNVIGSRKLSMAQQIRRAREIGRLGIIDRELRRYTDLLHRLRELPKTGRTEAMTTLCMRKLAHLRRRETLPKNRVLRVPPVLGELLKGNYRRFSKDWRRPAVDLLFP